MDLISHYPLQSSKHQIAGAMACVELGVRIVGSQPVSKGKQFLFRLISVKQMETAYDLVYRKWTGCKDVFQPAMSTSREQQAICVQS